MTTTTTPPATAAAPPPAPAEGVQLAEVLGAFSYALDVTEGQPEGHCVRACWIGLQLGEAIGLEAHELRELYYTILLKDLGCSSNAARVCQLYLTDDLGFKREAKFLDSGLAPALNFVFSHTGLQADLADRLKALANIMRNGGEIMQELFETRCQRGADIARKLRFSEEVANAIHCLDEHWDGGGRPSRLAGDAIPIYSRIALLAQVVDVFHRSAGPEAAKAEVARRHGRWFDPELTAAFNAIARPDAFWRTLCDPGLDAQVFALEPAREEVLVDEDYLDDIAAAFGQVVDAKSPFTAGHSARVGLYADLISNQLGVSPAHARWIRRGAVLHDIGKLGVSNSLLDKPGRLDGDELEIMRGHAARTGEFLSRISAFKELAPIAAAHHERLDGAGYPLGLAGEGISFETRIISVADFFDALTADRPYRAAMPLEKALAIMDENAGPAIDPAVFEALKAGLHSLPEFAPSAPTSPHARAALAFQRAG
ncbi:MAG: HD domain-containing phosphohydrolase [Maricaulaceae bacterium]|jgi:HD-GYP domain-containing protein (c-di-GMP phosphodiesterase class II)